MAPADITATSPSGAAKRALLVVADAIDADVDRLAAEVTELLHREVPEFGDDPAAREETRRSSRVQMLAFVATVRRGERPTRVEPEPEALAFARATVRRGVPLSLVLRTYHLGLGFFLQAWQDRLARTELAQDARVDATQRLVAITFAFLDGLAQRLTEEYERERERWLQGAQALRAETIRSIIASKATDIDAASRALAYELRRHHTGLVLWSESEASGFPQLEAAAAEIAIALGSSRPLLLGVGTGRMWAWVGTDGPPDAAALDALAARSDRDTVSVGIGAPGRDLHGFRRTHRDADEAARIAMLASRRPGAITRYESVQLVALLAGDVERASRFVRDQLGPLGAATDARHACGSRCGHFSKSTGAGSPPRAASGSTRTRSPIASGAARNCSGGTPVSAASICKWR